MRFTLEGCKEGEILLFDKPLKWTSFDVVNRVRYDLCKYLGIKKLKVGHTGTLDPLATGLIILCTGKATKKINDLLVQDKEYIAEITLGATTPSSDLETEIDKSYATEHITEELIKTKIHAYLGTSEQRPPLFSAKKINGVRAYELARAGSNEELPPKEVTINEIEILNIDMPKVTFRVNCSKGTYIRSLARDIGISLESGAYLSALKRTKIGDYQLSDAMTIENFKKMI